MFCVGQQEQPSTRREILLGLRQEEGSHRSASLLYRCMNSMPRRTTGLSAVRLRAIALNPGKMSLPCFTLSVHASPPLHSRASHSITSTSRPVLASLARPESTRRAVLVAAAAALLVPARGVRGAAPAIADTISAARTALGSIDGRIDAARWDGVRTVLAAEPLHSLRKAATAAAPGLPEDLREPFLGAAEDMLTALRLLDGVVYGNVFIGEDRQILGTKVDLDTPRVYLADAKEALEMMADIVDSM